MAMILLQSTIPYAEDDWHVGRFSMLNKFLSSCGHRVIARNLEPNPAGLDPVLANLESSAFDELWLLGTDAGVGLSPHDIRGINAFRSRGGGLLTARDHEDLGSSLRALEQVGDANYFHSFPEPDRERHMADDRGTPTISWPNYHSGDNGDYQRITLSEPRHPIMLRADGTPLEFFPSHPHEGAIGTQECGSGGRVLATGVSQATNRAFNLVAAFEVRTPRDGRALVHSSFHHFADCNWYPGFPRPTFVSEPQADGMFTNKRALGDICCYAENAALWLAGHDT